jgi:hypothetical protein
MRKRAANRPAQTYSRSVGSSSAPHAAEVLLPYTPLPKNFFAAKLPSRLPKNFIYRGSCENFLWHVKRRKQKFDLIFTSPPYNLGKPYTDYSNDRELGEYLDWQESIITDCIECLEDQGSICWQVGNYVSNGLVVRNSRTLQQRSAQF